MIHSAAVSYTHLDVYKRQSQTAARGGIEEDLAMSDIFDALPNRRAIIDRRLLSDRLDAIAAETSDNGARRRAMVALLKSALDDGRAEIERRLLCLLYTSRCV